jgi:predicted MPP superfamily phosphohydrolase
MLWLKIMATLPLYPLLTGPLTVEQITVSVVGLPLRLAGTRLVQLSDFHFDGLRLSPKLLQAAIAQCNALNPDLVVLTGDFVTQDARPIYPLAAALQQLQSRYGCYAVLGNHDDVTPSGRLMVIDGLNRAQVTVLWNEIAYPLGPDLPLVGLADLWSGPLQSHLLRELDDRTPRILLAHNPDTAAQLGDCRVDLQLSGHTHGGQIVLPRLGPIPRVMRQVRRYLPQGLRNTLPYMSDRCDQITRHWEWASGLHQVQPAVGDRPPHWLYVNRGLGTYLPGRWRCPPEVTLITLQPAHPALVALGTVAAAQFIDGADDGGNEGQAQGPAFPQTPFHPVVQ